MTLHDYLSRQRVYCSLWTFDDGINGHLDFERARYSDF